MYKLDFLIAVYFCNHAHMRYVTAIFVSPEENEVAFFYILQPDFFSVPALFVGSARKYNIYTLERGAEKAGAVHAYACGAAPFIRSARIGTCCLDNSGHLLIQVTGNVGAACSVFRSKRGIFATVPGCQFARFTFLPLGFGNFSCRAVIFSTLTKSRLGCLARGRQKQEKN